MSKLNGIEVPSHYNGVGLHDTPGAETAVWAYDEAANHARDLRVHGVTLYKLFGSSTKGSRAQAYRDQGIVVLHRWWPGGPHWGKPPAEWLMPSVDYNYLLGCGVALFEPGWNEFNIAEEWVTSIPYAPGIARAVLDAWEEAGARYGSFDHLLFPSNTPGGNVDHRACYRAIAAEITNRGLAGTIKHVAIHPRPLNNPPDTTWTATNTCTFDEWRWIRDQFRAVGVNAYYWATEHGYSIDYDQNYEYPPMTLTSWTDYNWELFVRLNPAHQQATEPGLAGVTYWFNAGWGHWGFWGRDALVDSPEPEMPAPSPLWVKMGDLSGALAFSRCEGQEPPVTDRARGIDISKYQNDAGPIDYAAVAASVDFVFVRASVGDQVDPNWEENYAGLTGAGVKWIGAYHYLKPGVVGQAGTLAAAVNGKRLPLGCWCDIEDNELTDGKCETFFQNADVKVDHTIGIYTSASKFNRFGSPPWAAWRELWVAHWGVDEPILPDAWNEWKFWQTTSDGSVPGIIGRVDLNLFGGTVVDLETEYGNGEEEKPYMDVKVFDKDGIERDWQWVLDEFGPLDVREAEPVLMADGSLQVVRLVEVREQLGPSTLVVSVRGLAGGAVVNRAVAFHWPDAPELPAITPPTSVWEDRAVVGQTNENGDVGFGMGDGAYYYWPDRNEAGPHGVWVLDPGRPSDGLFGLGMIAGTDHRHLNCTYQVVKVEDEPPIPEPGDEDLAAVVERLDRVIEILETVYRLG